MSHEADRRIRVAIVDDHPIFRDALRRLLEHEPDLDVVAEGEDGNAAIRIAREVAPDVMLLDVAMPRLDGVAALADAGMSATRVVILTAGVDEQQMIAALQAGVRGVVLKEAATSTLIETIRAVVAGQVMIPTDVAAVAAGPRRVLTWPPLSLTVREMDIVRRVATGRSNREIAEALGIAVQTVKHHLTVIFDKTGTSSRLELALFAIRQQIGGAVMDDWRRSDD